MPRYPNFEDLRRREDVRPNVLLQPNRIFTSLDVAAQLLQIYWVEIKQDTTRAVWVT